MLSLEVAGAVSVWFETFLYGIYTALFFTSLYITLKRKMLYTTSSKIFFVTTIVMFGVCTLHIAINLFRLLRAYVLLRDENGGPSGYWIDLGRWDNILHDVLNAIMTWLGDSLVIYRCYLIWNSNLYIVIIPSILVAISIVANSVALHLFTQVPLGTIFGPSLVHWMNTIYAVALVQNVITTTLIAYRIWRQEADARSVGIRSSGSRASLIPVVRIIVESAMLYAAELVCLIALYAVNSNGQYIMQEASVPSVGIVFTLISVRMSIHSSRIMRSTTKGRMTTQSLHWNRSLTVDTEELGTDIIASELLPSSDPVKSEGGDSLGTEGDIQLASADGIKRGSVPGPGMREGSGMQVKV